MADQQRKVTDDMLELLVKSLPDDFNEIKHFKNSNNYDELLKAVHKLHGAVCYCGVPELRASIQALETALKKNQFSAVPELFNLFEAEVDRVLKSVSSD